MKLLDAPIYQTSLTKAISKANSRIVLASMIFLREPAIDAIFLVLEQALRRGVAVTIVIDAYNKFLFTEDTNLLKLGALRQRAKETYAYLRQLQELGGTVIHVSKINHKLFKDRFHTKFSVIDNTVYFAGGVNMSAVSFVNIDYMIETKNSPALGDALIANLMRIVTDGKADNESYRIDKQNTLFMDGGRQHQSLIYNRAIELAEKAVRIIYVSQYCPSGALAKALKDKDTTYYYNRTRQLATPFWIDQALSHQKYKIKNNYLKKDYLHAKCILYEFANGQKVLLSGSHNFNYRGVQFGTQEIALESTDTKLWKQIYTFVQTKVV